MGNLIALSTFIIAILSGALLMFLLEPLVAMLFLPVLGGGPNIWNTCVCFFQFLLLLGYTYAYFVSRLKSGVQLAIQTFVLLLPLLFLPIKAPQSEPVDEPFSWLLIQLLSITGALFFALSTASPMLQKWYANAQLWSSKDPYFLYAASNLGSMVGLIAYPLIVGPNLSISQQCTALSLIYEVFALFMIGSGAIMFLRQRKSNGETETKSNQEHYRLTFDKPTIRKYSRWLILCMLPSSLFLGVTTYVTTDMTSIPLFWVFPLGIYLLTIIIAFSRPPDWIIKWSQILAPVMVAVTMILTSYRATSPTPLGHLIVTIASLSPHLITLFIVCLACHGMVARERPQTDELNAYLFTFALGGVLGSVFNTLIAPLIFSDWIEYPLALSVAALYLIQWPSRKTDFKPLYVLLPVVVLSLSLYTSTLKIPEQIQNVMFPPILWHFGLPAIFAMLVARNVVQLRLALMSLIAFGIFFSDRDADNLSFKSRNFFGCIKVLEDIEAKVCMLKHGTTIHGFESLDPEQRGMPISYYTSMSPIGNVMLSAYGLSDETDGNETTLASINKQIATSGQNSTKTHSEPFAVVGLGTGTMSAYAKKGQTIVFYEIDPAVIKIANNPFCFTYLYLARKRGVDVKIEQGDARLRLAKAPYNFYRLIVVDAFSSDSIPTHLLTAEALDLYLQKLTSDGCLVFHISNSYYDLKPALAALAYEKNLIAYGRFDEGRGAQTLPGEWVMVTKNETLLKRLKALGWGQLAAPHTRVWTDDYSNPLGLLWTRQFQRSDTNLKH